MSNACTACEKRVWHMKRDHSRDVATSLNESFESFALIVQRHSPSDCICMITSLSLEELERRVRSRTGRGYIITRMRLPLIPRLLGFYELCSSELLTTPTVHVSLRTGNTANKKILAYSRGLNV